MIPRLPTEWPLLSLSFGIQGDRVSFPLFSTSLRLLWTSHHFQNDFMPVVLYVLFPLKNSWSFLRINCHLGEVFPDSPREHHTLPLIQLLAHYSVMCVLMYLSPSPSPHLVPLPLPLLPEWVGSIRVATGSFILISPRPSIKRCR